MATYSLPSIQTLQVRLHNTTLHRLAIAKISLFSLFDFIDSVLENLTEYFSLNQIPADRVSELRKFFEVVQPPQLQSLPKDIEILVEVLETVEKSLENFIKSNPKIANARIELNAKEKQAILAIINSIARSLEKTKRHNLSKYLHEVENFVNNADTISKRVELIIHVLATIRAQLNHLAPQLNPIIDYANDVYDYFYVKLYLYLSPSNKLKPDKVKEVDKDRLLSKAKGLKAVLEEVKRESLSIYEQAVLLYLLILAFALMITKAHPSEIVEIKEKLIALITRKIKELQQLLGLLEQLRGSLREEVNLALFEEKRLNELITNINSYSSPDEVITVLLDNIVQQEEQSEEKTEGEEEPLISTIYKLLLMDGKTKIRPLHLEDKQLTFTLKVKENDINDIEIEQAEISTKKGTIYRVTRYMLKGTAKEMVDELLLLRYLIVLDTFFHELGPLATDDLVRFLLEFVGGYARGQPVGILHPYVLEVFRPLSLV